jgi:hypothetical protein
MLDTTAQRDRARVVLLSAAGLYRERLRDDDVTGRSACAEEQQADEPSHRLSTLLGAVQLLVDQRVFRGRPEAFGPFRGQR